MAELVYKLLLFSAICLASLLAFVVPWGTLVPSLFGLLLFLWSALFASFLGAKGRHSVYLLLLYTPFFAAPLYTAAMAVSPLSFLAAVIAFFYLAYKRFGILLGVAYVILVAMLGGVYLYLIDLATGGLVERATKEGLMPDAMWTVPAFFIPAAVATVLAHISAAFIYRAAGIKPREE